MRIKYWAQFRKTNKNIYDFVSMGVWLGGRNAQHHLLYAGRDKNASHDNLDLLKN